jgi:hypothetical protein
MICKSCFKDKLVSSDKFISEFYLLSSGNPRSTCKTCDGKKVSDRRRANPDKSYRIRAREYSKIRKHHMRDIIDRAKSCPCVDCGRTFHPCAMDLDHRDNTTKLFSIANCPNRAICSIESLRKEIEKCDVVCAVCHRLRTHKKNQYSSRPTREFRN